MSLDQNLFTLFLVPNTSSSYPAGTVVDLTDASGTIHYRKRRIVAPSNQPQVYRIELSDPLSEAVLASATAPSATTKHKTVELYNPSKVVELKFTGTLSFRWSFKWEAHEFEWKREECFIVRKPDPPVLVAVTKEPPGRIRTASVQILDYNLHRFDIDDRKGLEIVILTALLTFQDASDVYHEPNASAPTAATATTSTTPHSSAPPPPPPPKPAPKKGVERIAELQLGRGQVNEVTVVDEGAVKDYAKFCSQLLQDEAMLFVSVRTSDADQVSKVLHVVEETKRLRHKAGAPDLHQYVLYDARPKSQGGPRVINLDDNDGGKGKGKSKTGGKEKEYTPPRCVTVHLSKIEMPELRPRGTPHPDRERGTKNKDKRKDKGKDRGGGGEKGKGKGQTAPPRRSTSPQYHNRDAKVLQKPRSQYFVPPAPPRPQGQGWSSRPAVPARPPPPPPGPGTLHRQSYGHEYGYGLGYGHSGGGGVEGPSNGTSSGILGRLLGR